VIGVNRGDQADALRERGADNIVESLLQVEVVDMTTKVSRQDGATGTNGTAS
jgi:hypothetical protein